MRRYRATLGVVEVEFTSPSGDGFAVWEGAVELRRAGALGDPSGTDLLDALRQRWPQLGSDSERVRAAMWLAADRPDQVPGEPCPPAHP